MASNGGQVEGQGDHNESPIEMNSVGPGDGQASACSDEQEQRVVFPRNDGRVSPICLRCML